VRRKTEKQYWEKKKREKRKDLGLCIDQRDKPYTFLSLFLTID